MRETEGAGGHKLSAAWLIERCGMKGATAGAFEVSSKHALVIVHRGGGDAHGLLEFAASIRRRVEERFGIVLEMEPRVLGA